MLDCDVFEGVLLDQIFQWCCQTFCFLEHQGETGSLLELLLVSSEQLEITAQQFFIQGRTIQENGNLGKAILE
ncbi:hypothetical protein D3C84_712840 [compost metagenome]